MPKIIVITGPTATGKTLLGAQLAKKLNGEVVSADSMQVYKYMDIGTAKPTADEMDGVVHHMISIVHPREDYSVARYVDDATACVEDILARNKQPIVVGGSGFYIDSLISGRIFASRGNPRLRKALEVQYDKTGGAAMLSELRALDGKYAATLHENDKKRIVRALEAIETSGKPLSDYSAEEIKPPKRYEALKIALTFKDRAVLYNRINLRVDKMLEQGLVDEVSSLLDRGVSRTGTSMQAIGYKEIAEALNSATDLTSAVEKIKMESTRYAKRQLTWLRRDDTVNWIMWDNIPDIESGLERIQEFPNEAK